MNRSDDGVVLAIGLMVFVGVVDAFLMKTIGLGIVGGLVLILSTVVIGALAWWLRVHMELEPLRLLTATVCAMLFDLWFIYRKHYGEEPLFSSLRKHGSDIDFALSPDLPWFLSAFIGVPLALAAVVFLYLSWRDR